MADYYQLLKVAHTATPDQIQAAYHRERARLLAGAGEDEAGVAPVLQALEQAYNVLGDPSQRAVYDQARGRGQVNALTVPNNVGALQTGLNPPTPFIEQRACPNCGALNPAQATICAACSQQISRPCPKCGNAVLDGERVCSRCRTVIAEYDQNRFLQAEAHKKQIHAERTASEIRVEALEQTHRTNRVFGFTFWAIVLGLTIGVCVLGGLLLSLGGR